MSSDIEDLYQDKSDREIAVELEISEEEVKKRRKDSGFLRLEEFNEDEELAKQMELSVELDEMQKRKLQGFMGEKITSLMKKTVTDRLKNHLKDSWVLRDKLHVVNNESGLQRYWASGRPRQGSIRIEGRNLKHHGSAEEELREYVKERCVVAEEAIFTKFREVRNPFIDFNFYAVRRNGSKKVKFTVRDYNRNSFDSEEQLEIEVPVIEDFKIVMLEVKTTKDDAKNLLSENQRKARDLAKNSPFLEFFSLKVDKEFDELSLPDEFDINLNKHS